MKKKTSFICLAIIILGIPILWLSYASIVLDIEYYDGLDVILNAHYFLGEYPTYLAHKAPFLAIIIIPALLISKLLQLDSLNLIIYHIEMALLHISYLLTIFYLLVREYKKTTPILIAFSATILTFVFFSYGLFLNIDIFPGLLFLLMVLFSEAYKKRPDWKTWMVLTLIGAIAALLKQTFGLFWFAILIAQVFSLVISRDCSKKSLIIFLKLCAGSITSFMVYFLLMCFVLKDSVMQGSFFFNPIIQIINFSKEYSNPNMIPPIWIYAANFPFYGLLTTLLIIPALIMGLKSKNALQRTLAVCWIVAFVIMHIICRREVRYIAFLAPISAFLLVAPIRYLIKTPRYLYFMLLVLCIDLFFAGVEAGRITKTFYQKSQLKQFLLPLTKSNSKIKQAKLRKNKCITNDYLCFMPPLASPFRADPYHRKFHFSPYHMQFFLGQYTNFEWQPYKASNLLKTLPYFDKSFLIFCNFFPINLGEESPGLSDYMILFTTSKTILKNPKEALIIDKQQLQRDSIICTIRNKTIDMEKYIFPCLYDTKNSIAFPFIQLEKQKFRIEKPKGYQGNFPDFNLCEIRGYQILYFVYMENNGTKIRTLTK